MYANCTHARISCFVLGKCSQFGILVSLLYVCPEILRFKCLFSHESHSVILGLSPSVGKSCSSVTVSICSASRRPMFQSLALTNKGFQVDGDVKVLSSRLSHTADGWMDQGSRSNMCKLALLEWLCS